MFQYHAPVTDSVDTRKSFAPYSSEAQQLNKIARFLFADTVGIQCLAVGPQYGEWVIEEAEDRRATESERVWMVKYASGKDIGEFFTEGYRLSDEDGMVAQGHRVTRVFYPDPLER